MELVPEYDDDGALITDKTLVSKTTREFDISPTTEIPSTNATTLLVKNGSYFTKEAYPYRKEYRKIAFSKLPSQRSSLEMGKFTHASRTSIFGVKHTKPKSKQKLTTPRMIARRSKYLTI